MSTFVKRSLNSPQMLQYGAGVDSFSASSRMSGWLMYQQRQLWKNRRGSEPNRIYNVTLFCNWTSC